MCQKFLRGRYVKCWWSPILDGLRHATEQPPPAEEETPVSDADERDTDNGVHPLPNGSTVVSAHCFDMASRTKSAKAKFDQMLNRGRNLLQYDDGNGQALVMTSVPWGVMDIEHDRALKGEGMRVRTHARTHTKTNTASGNTAHRYASLTRNNTRNADMKIGFHGHPRTQTILHTNCLHEYHA
jgi:hypothetical protein